MGRAVKIKVWIHYFIGDTEGFNKWLGHYPGNKRQVCRPYQDCHCGFDELKNPNPLCVYVTFDEMREAKRVKRNDYNEGLALLKSMSQHNPTMLLSARIFLYLTKNMVQTFQWHQNCCMHLEMVS
jgi:hypothetical protein